jgi:hypothetical protein
VAAPAKPRQLQVPPIPVVRPMLDGLVGVVQTTTFRSDAGVPGLSAGAVTSSGSAMP